MVQGGSLSQLGSLHSLFSCNSNDADADGESHNKHNKKSYESKYLMRTYSVPSAVLNPLPALSRLIFVATL